MTDELPRRLLGRLESLRADLIDLEQRHAAALREVPAADRDSARNLVHYLALRQHDLRPLQLELSRRGLSSLGRAEAHVLSNLDAVIAALRRMLDGGDDAPDHGIGAGAERLENRANRTLGLLKGDRASRIMVTMPRDAASDPELVVRLARAGMDLARINTAHDGPAIWAAIAANVRAAEQVTGRRILVAFDLAGPKLRTGPLAPGPQVVRVRPERDELGRVEEPARVALVPAFGTFVQPGVVELPVAGDLRRLARLGDEVRFTDSRRRRRRLRVEGVVDVDREPVVLAATDRTAYLVPGTVLELVRERQTAGHGEIGALPPVPAAIRLSIGDRLWLRAGDVVGEAARPAKKRQPAAPAFIGVPVPEVFRDVQVGQRILFDDGNLQGIIRTVQPDAFEVEVTRLAGRGGKLRAEKGINLPDTALEVAALTDEDRDNLAAVIEYADLVSMSFVQRPEDVDDLVDALEARGRPDVGIVLKIETNRAFVALPAILLRALQRHSEVAVMIARGDLAVEVGFERLSEIQEEVLWLAEAAHVPTIWATQVLEGLAKTGVPSRAEVTDAVAGTRAECVMLNKGAHIDEAVEFLVDVIARARGHQEKKRPMLRRLRVADFASV